MEPQYPAFLVLLPFDVTLFRQQTGSLQSTGDPAV